MDALDTQIADKEASKAKLEAKGNEMVALAKDMLTNDEEQPKELLSGIVNWSKTQGSKYDTQIGQLKTKKSRDVKFYEKNQAKMIRLLKMQEDDQQGENSVAS